MKMRINKFFFTAFSILCLSAKAQESKGISLDQVDSSRFMKVATLQVLDKTTAKTSVLKIKVKESQNFGRISIRVDKCWQATLDQKPDSRILVEISQKDKKEEKRIFYGWLIASSPSISGLEHPIYDVIALGCKYR